MVDMADKSVELKFRDRVITAKPLMESQITLLSVLNTGSATSTARSAHVIFRVLENRVGPQEWARIEEDMISGAPMADFTELLHNLIEATAKLRSEPAPVSGDDIEAKIREARELLSQHPSQDLVARTHPINEQ